jgi:hypothetical protein
MQDIIKAPRDFVLGAIYLAVGAFGLWIALDFPSGTAGRMGPGYMPRAVCALLVVFGFVSIALAFLRDGEGISRVNWRPLLIVIGATALFAFLLEPAGVVIALALLVLVSSLAAPGAEFSMRNMFWLLVLIVFCIVVFVEGLGIPMRLFGSWFEG